MTPLLRIGIQVSDMLKLRVYIAAANPNDREGLQRILAGSMELFPQLKKIWADAGYGG